MLRIENVKVYDLQESIIACRNAMRTELPEQTTGEYLQSLPRAKKLVETAVNSGIRCHANFRTGIRVSFDIYYPQYWTIEAQRYHWFDIVTSSSKMHMITKMDIKESCNKYVDERVIEVLKEKIAKYNEMPTSAGFMEIISNVPMGLELFMRVSTNYEQLATMYRQRRHHRLEDWQNFCDWVETLPMAKELITYGEEEK